jgi:hypothetical protein
VIVHNFWNEFGTSFLWSLQDLRWRNHDVLRLIVFSGSFSLILSFLSCGFFVAFLKVGVDVFGDGVNLLFERRQTLNSINLNEILNTLSII